MPAIRSLCAAWAAASLLCACATPTHIQAYPGPELPKGQVALLKPVVGVQVLAVDGDKAYAVKTQQGIGYLDVEIALLPGAHRIAVMYNSGSGISTGFIMLDLLARSGRKYLITYTPTAYSFSPRIDDRTDRPETWCALRAASASEKGC